MLFADQATVLETIIWVECNLQMTNKIAADQDNNGWLIYKLLTLLHYSLEIHVNAVLQNIVLPNLQNFLSPTKEKSRRTSNLGKS